MTGSASKETAPTSPNATLRQDVAARIIGSLSLLISTLLLAATASSWHDARNQTQEVEATALAPLPKDMLVTLDHAAILVSLNALDAALESSRPYAAELAIAFQIIGDREDFVALLDRLIDRAETGVPTSPALIEAWQVHAADVSGFQSQMEGVLQRLFFLSSPNVAQDAALREMTMLIDRGDFEAAASRISRLNQSKQDSVRPWFDDARTRSEANWVRVELQRLIYTTILSEPA